jgi:multidrug efflux pump subunit AcrA (membrane-fusion protein)
MRTWVKRLLIVPPLLAGVAVLAWIVAGREPPVRAPAEEQVRTVRVIEVPEVRVVPRAIGQGLVRPGRIWEAVAQVDGRVIEVHPRLEQGAILETGAILARIDPRDYELEVARLSSAIEGAGAELAALEQRSTNLEASLEIERRALVLAENDLARKRRLAATAALSQAAVDEEEILLLQQRQQVQNLDNEVGLIPPETRRLEAQIAQLRAELEAAKLDLERTEITLPFTARIAETNVEVSEFVRRGDILLRADGLASAEITARVPIAQLRSLMVLPDEAAPVITPEAAPAILQRMGLSATVRLRAGPFETSWDAEVARISDTVDPKTRAVGIIVVVDDPFSKAIPGERPPLVKNMFVEVELRGRPQPPSPVVPRSALHEGRVYVVTDDDRLEIRPVEPALRQDDLASIGVGLSPGEMIVVSDLIPAIEGQKLDPVVDEELRARLIDKANGDPGT